NYCAEPKIEEHVMNVTSDTVACRIPKLDPFHPHAMKLVEDLSNPLRCKTEQKAILSGGELNITGTDVAHASYRYISRTDDDFSFLISDPIKILTWKQFPVPHEYIELTLILTNGNELKEYLLQVVPKKEIISRPSPASELDLNVLIIGIDSISNGHAQRKLPKSYNYIRNVLEGYVFMGHSVVGDGTTEQLAAFLTGQGEQEYAESRRGKRNAKPVDNWNWIFKKAKAHGYVTSFCEDSPGIGTFQYRLLGFKDPPTDYYPRAFFMAAHDGAHSKRNPHCYGSEKIYNYHLDLARKIYEQYPQRKKFLFHFPGEISHDSFNSVQLIDNDLLQFLTKFNTKGYLNNTLLILLGDHGWRYGDFRQTVQGKLEERLPLFSMTFPKWFKQKYPTLAKNLRTNTKRLTSWFDLYATFNHLLDYPNKPMKLKHGTSLLTEVPLERSCKDASIPQHWCPCVQWSAVDRQHEHLQQAALIAINHINDLNFQEPLGAERCSQLSLFKLYRAEVETPTTQVLRFRRSGRDGRKAEFSGSIRAKDHCSYQLTFITLPNHGVFEASVHYLYGRFLVKGSISRINKYGDQPKCIANLLPHLRKYCYCK
ncbi:uncharacterized protein LOC113676100 isoform X1, partial [Paramuricea clavata]